MNVTNEVVQKLLNWDQVWESGQPRTFFEVLVVLLQFLQKFWLYVSHCPDGRSHVPQVEQLNMYGGA